MDIDRLYQAIPVQHPQVVGRVEDGEAVLVLPQQGKVKVLNEVGARIWELCDGQRTIEAIAQQIASEYAVELAVAKSDALEFIQSLSTKGLITLER